LDITLNELKAKGIDRTGAISNKRQSDIEQKWKASSLDKSLLFKTKGSSNLNKTVNYYGGRGNKFSRYRKKSTAP